MNYAKFVFALLPELDPAETIAGRRIFREILVQNLDGLQTSQLEESLDCALKSVLWEKIRELENKIVRLDLTAHLAEEALDHLQLLNYLGEIEDAEYDLLAQSGNLAESLKKHVDALYAKLDTWREALIDSQIAMRLGEIVEESEGRIISQSELDEIMGNVQRRYTDLELTRKAMEETAGEGLGELNTWVMQQAEDFTQQETRKREQFFETKERVIKALQKRRKPKYADRGEVGEEAEDQEIKRLIASYFAGSSDFRRMKAALPENRRRQIEQIIKDREKLEPLRKELKAKLEGARQYWAILQGKLAAASSPEEVLKGSQPAIGRYLEMLDDVTVAKKELEEAQRPTFQEVVVEELVVKSQEMPRGNDMLRQELARLKENQFFLAKARKEMEFLIASDKEKDWDQAVVLDGLLERASRGKVWDVLVEVEKLQRTRKISLDAYAHIVVFKGSEMTVN